MALIGLASYRPICYSYVALCRRAKSTRWLTDELVPRLTSGQKFSTFELREVFCDILHRMTVPGGLRSLRNGSNESGTEGHRTIPWTTDHREKTKTMITSVKRKKDSEMFQMLCNVFEITWAYY